MPPDVTAVVRQSLNTWSNAGRATGPLGRAIGESRHSADRNLASVRLPEFPVAWLRALGPTAALGKSLNRPATSTARLHEGPGFSSLARTTGRQTGRGDVRQYLSRF